MEDSLTGTNNASLDQEPTSVNEPADVSSDTTSQAPVEQDVVAEPAGESEPADSGLSKFAKAQGFDLDNASEDTKRALKIALDNQRSFRSAKQLADTSNPTDDLRAEVANLKYERQVERFFGGQGRDRNLEAVMYDIVKDKAAKYGVEYANNLRHDLDALYDLAVLKSSKNTSNVDPEQIRREERESINQQLQQGAQAHATDQTPTVTTIQDVLAKYEIGSPEYIAAIDKLTN